VIFLDTSGILALAMEADIYHDRAVEMMMNAEATGRRMLVHSYVLVESAAIMQNRIGREAAIAFLESASSFDVVWVSPQLHAQALELLKQNSSSKLSFVDVVSFVVMRLRAVTEFIGFDKHFVDAGFIQFGSQIAG